MTGARVPDHTRSRGVGIWGLGLAFLLSLLPAACSSRPLQNAASSTDALARSVLDAISGRDETRLRALALSEQEFREVVWPRLPAARPERNLPFSFVWGDLRQKSNAALANTLARHGGHHYELLDVSFTGKTDYVDYTVHREATFRVKEESGAESRIRVCGSMIEQDGAWKIFSFVIDD